MPIRELQETRLVSKPRRGRPPKEPADAEARQRLIRAGLVFLTERGFLAAGINDILLKSGVPKGCFYHYFRDKADFGSQVIDAYQSYFSRKLDSCFLDDDLPPFKRIQAFVDDAAAGMSRHAFRRGCLVGNLGQEMGCLPETFREKLVLIFEDWQSRTADCLRLAQEVGELSEHRDAAALARFFWIGWEGAVLRAKLERKVDPLTEFAAGFFTILTT